MKIFKVKFAYNTGNLPAVLFYFPPEGLFAANTAREALNKASEWAKDKILSGGLWDMSKPNAQEDLDKQCEPIYVELLDLCFIPEAEAVTAVTTPTT